MNIRRDVSKILSYTILVDDDGAKWDEAFKKLQIEGRITSKHILGIIILLLKREEAREKSREQK